MRARDAVVGALAALLIAVPGAHAQSGYDLFQQALVKERSNGQLREAIELYRKIVAEHGTDRALAARALVQMGRAYETLGSPEAPGAYERVVRDYADQRERAAEARARLAVLSRDPAAPLAARHAVARLVWPNASGRPLGPPSPNGQYLPYLDGETGSLLVRDLASGESRVVEQGSSYLAGGWNAGRAVFSPDGEEVAYVWMPGVDLRVAALDGGATRTIYRHEAIYPEPWGWTHDGSRILVLMHHTGDQTRRIALMDAADGSFRVLRTLDWSPAEPRLSLSPDGRFVAYSVAPQEGSDRRDVFVLAVDGSREAHVVDHPADDFVIGWAPDGDRLLFASDRSGRLDAWTVRVRDGEAGGAPELVRADLAADPLGPLELTASGVLYYQVYSGWADVLTATLDPATGEVLEPPVQIMGRFEGANSAPDWSPDGRYLVSRSHPNRQRAFLLIRDMETAEVRELQPRTGSFNFHFLRWSPDARRVLVVGVRDEEGRYGLGAVDVESGEVEIIAPARPEDGFIYSPEWAPDGRSLFYHRSEATRARIIRLDLTTDVEHELYGAGRIRQLVISPDGGQLAFVEGDSIKVMPATGGQPRVVLGADGIRTLAWTADGEHLLYATGTSFSPDDTSELWKVSVASGVSQRTSLEAKFLMHLRMHPDGRRLAFTAAVRPDRIEVWALENFLPADAEGSGGAR